MGLLGRVVLALALVEAGLSGWKWFGDGTPFRSVGAFWYANHPTSLQLAQPAIERYVLPELWNPLIVTMLNWPLVAVLLVLGAALLLLGRVKRRRRLMR